MAIRNGLAIINSGLVLCLDAADKNSYPGSGTTWKDITSTNNNATLVNGPVFDPANGGSIFTDGTDDTITTTDAGLATDSYTFSIWFKNDNYSELKYVCGRGKDGGFGNGWSLSLSINTNGNLGLSVVPTLPSVLSFSAVGTSVLALNKWYYLTGVWTSNTSIKSYINGVSEATTSTSGYTSLRTSTIGWWISGISAGNFTSGYNAAMHIYNRSLTDSEILQNYNAQKSRFNL